MAAILGSIRRRRRRPRPVNYSIEHNNGREYRVCTTNYGRVLFVMLKHKRAEQPLEYGARRFREIVRKTEEEYNVALKWTRHG